MWTRRDWLRRSALISLAPAVPGFLARSARGMAPDRDGRILVVIQLDGGNDGINTVVPFADEDYRRHRSALRISSDRLCKLDDRVGLHPDMRPAADMLQEGRLAIVQGVGYPNPDRSHFRSMAIWQSAKFDPDGLAGPGWLGRALDASGGARRIPDAVFIGGEELPRALHGRRSVASSFADASDLTLTLPALPSAAVPTGNDLAAFVVRTVANAYATAAELEAIAKPGRPTVSYPGSALARRLELIAQSIRSGSMARVYYAIQPGYDTHSVQLPAHAEHLGEFARAIRAFLDDLSASKLADRVLLMAFSEFGRRPEENGSLGTDHGTAGPVFLAGPMVKPGLIGEAPKLGDLEGGDLKWSIDFRRVYASLLDGWLGVAASDVLGSRFEPLPVLKA